MLWIPDRGQEKPFGMNKKKKQTILHIIWIAILVLIAAVFYWLQRAETPAKFYYGVSFSNWTVEGYGLDWKKAYLEILDDLKVDRIRLSAYWNRIEPQIDQYDFNDLDWMVAEADKRDERSAYYTFPNVL